MCKSTYDFLTLHTYNLIDVAKLNTIVDHPNGTKSQVSRIGILRVSDTILLTDVLVVSDYHVSMVFVHKLSEDNKLRLIFYEGKCFIQDSVQRTLVGIRSERDDLYFLIQVKSLLIKTYKLVVCLNVCGIIDVVILLTKFWVF